VVELTSGSGQTTKLERRVATAARSLLDSRRCVTPVDVLVVIGWLPPGDVQRWQREQVACLEETAVVDPDRLRDMLAVLERWARSAGLEPTETQYLSGSRHRSPLRFTADGDPVAEEAYRRSWTPPQLSERDRDRVVTKRSAPPDLVVVWAIRDWTCGECGGSDGELLIMEHDRPLCLSCADLDHLVFLPSGDTALTRRARKGSSLSAVVVRFSRARKRHERQGVLVEQGALDAAEEQCLGDADARERRRERERERRAGQDDALVTRMTDEVLRLFPGCPRERASAIADHACVRGSGRVGRSAAGRGAGEDAVRLAVVASVRHQDTDYDQLLMSGVDRYDARHRVQAGIEQVLDSWRAP
jgi:hypothetical protein